jgi:DNA-binding CsgD family transcriptional regulator
VGFSSDWEFLGNALLEREARPVIVLGLDGRIVAVNRALHFLLRQDTPTDLIHFGEEWTVPEMRERFRCAWERALGGKRGRVSVRISPCAFGLDLVLDLIPLANPEGRVRSVMMIVVESHAASPSVPLKPAHGLVYEVRTDGHGSTGKLLRATSAEQEAFDLSQPCFRSLFGREKGCETCPVRALGKERTATVIRTESHSPFRALVMAAKQGREDVAAVSVTPLEERTYSSLFHARATALGQRAKLTPREQQVFHLLLMGRALADVATVEGISVRTAKYHQQNLLRKVGAESRMDLFRLLS